MKAQTHTPPAPAWIQAGSGQKNPKESCEGRWKMHLITEMGLQLDQMKAECLGRWLEKSTQTLLSFFIISFKIRFSFCSQGENVLHPNSPHIPSWFRVEINIHSWREVGYLQRDQLIEPGVGRKKIWGVFGGQGWLVVFWTWTPPFSSSGLPSAFKQM